MRRTLSLRGRSAAGRARLPLLLLVLLLPLGLALGILALSQTAAVRQRALLWAESRLQEMLQREVRVEGVTLQPWAGRVDLTGIRVASGRTVAEGVLFSADAIQARWSWTALFRRQLVFRHIRLLRPRLAPADGTAPGLPVQDGLSLLLRPQLVEGRGWVLRLRRASVQDGQAAWTASDGVQGRVEGLEGEFAWPGGTEGEGPATAHVRAARLTITRGDRTHRLDRVSLQVTGTAEAVSVSAAEFHLAGARVTAHGRIANPTRDPRLDLEMGVQAPLTAVLSLLGADRQIEGTLVVDGRMQGPWDQAAFRGAGKLQLGTEPRQAETLPFSIRWEGERVEVEARGGTSERDGSFQGMLSLAPTTGAYQVRAHLSNTNLTALAGLPLGLGWSQADLPLPAGVRGRLTADVDLSGRGADLATLRGHAVFSVEDLALEGETPTGSLQARIAATASRLDVETFTLRTAGGEIQGRGGLNFSTGKLELPLRANLRDVGAFAKGFGVRALDGQADLSGRVTGTREEPRLQGRLTWRGARIAGQAVDLIQGEIEVARRVLRTTGLVMRSGKSRATVRGSLQALGTTPLRRLNLKRELGLDVQGKLDPARTADLIGLIPEDVEVQGTFRASGRVTGTLERLTGDITLGLEDVRTWEEAWTRGAAVVRFRQGDVEITGIDFRRGAERITGQIRLPDDGSLQGQLQSTSMDLARVGTLSRSGLTGRASFRLNLQGTQQASRVLIQATGSRVWWRGISMGVATGALRVERKTVDMNITFLEGTHRLQARIGPPPASLFTGELTLLDADLGAVLQAAKVKALRPWRPRGDGRIVIREKPEDLGSTRGEAEFKSLRMVMNGHPFQSQGPVRASWDEPGFKLEPVRLRSGGHEVEVRGEGGTGNRIDLQITGQIPLTAVADQLKGWTPQAGVAAGTLRLRGNQDSPEPWGRVEIRQGRLTLEGLPAELQDVHASLDLQGARIKVPQYLAILAGGTLRGSAEFRRSEDQWYLGVSFQEDDGRVEELLPALVGEKREFTGTLSLGGAVWSQGEATTGLTENMTGSLALRMRDGILGRYTVAAKILAILNLADLVETQGSDVNSRGMPYQQITADFKIERGVARTENLVLKSPAMRMTAVGSINLAEKTVEMTMGVQPFQHLDWIFTKIPVAGWLLGGKEQSLVVAYFQVTGPLSDPQVSTVPFKSISRNVFGILRNLLELPESLNGPYKDLPAQKTKQDEELKR
jgi:uncharacterized protein involved in outer membrane biogenesis